MILLICPHCKQEIDAYVKICPYCHSPHKADKYFQRCSAIIYLTPLIFFSIYFLTHIKVRTVMYAIGISIIISIVIVQFLTKTVTFVENIQRKNSEDNT